MKRIVYQWQTIKTVFGCFPGRFRRADVGGVSASADLRRVNPSTIENNKNRNIVNNNNYV